MKKSFAGLLFLFLVLFAGFDGWSQEIEKYDFLEVIVIQKANNSGKSKENQS